MNIHHYRNRSRMYLSSVLLSLNLHAQTFDDAVEAVYKEKPYLYVRSDESTQKKPRKNTQSNYENDEQKESLITWEHLEHGIDIGVLAYATWRIRGIYQTIYGTTAQTRPYEKNSITEFIDCCAQRFMPPWITNANNHRQFGMQTTMTLMQVYLYRTLARYTLVAIRYGVVQPISWIVRGIKAVCGH